MSVLHMLLSVPTSQQSLSSLKTMAPGQVLIHKFSHLSLTIPSSSFKSTTIRMGGGPRTYPGGVSKWQWKRMQAKKAKKLLTARLARERQIYEMRKRAELKAAVSELERPWEIVEKAPNLFSVSADEQLKVLADRFQRPGGFDMWSESDGPELFKPDNGLPSARFFPKGVVNSIRPYGKIEKLDDGSEECESSHLNPNSFPGLQSEGNTKKRVQRHVVSEEFRNLTNRLNERENLCFFSAEDVKNSLKEDSGRKLLKNKITKNNNRKRFSNDSVEVGYSKENARKNLSPSNTDSRRHGMKKVKDPNYKFYDLNLQKDGSYKFQAENRQRKLDFNGPVESQ